MDICVGTPQDIQRNKPQTHDVGVAGRRDGRADGHDEADLYTESEQTLLGSFSAVSKPIFPTEYSLESSPISKICQDVAEILLNFTKIAGVTVY